MVCFRRLCHNRTMNRTRERQPEGRGGRGSAAPVAVFAGLVVIVALAAGAALFLGAEPAELSESGGSGTPSRPAAGLPLSDAEAVSRFTELDRTRLQLFEHPDTADVHAAFVPRSPAARRAQRSLRELDRRGVSLIHTLYRTRRLKVLSNTQGRIELEQEVLLRTRLVSANGTNLTNDDRPKRQVIRWVLEPSPSGWLLFDGNVVEAEFTTAARP